MISHLISHLVFFSALNILSIDDIHSGVTSVTYLDFLLSPYTVNSPKPSSNFFSDLIVREGIAPTLMPLEAISKIIHQSLRSAIDRSFEISCLVYDL